MTTYGKFNSAEELLKGYNELEKSFTQKCQQLAQLQKQQEQDGTSAQAPPSTLPTTIPDVTVSREPTQQQLQQYLLDNPHVVQRLLQTQTTQAPPTVITEGGSLSLVLPTKPKTIKEATVLAKKMFGN